LFKACHEKRKMRVRWITPTQQETQEWLRQWTETCRTQSLRRGITNQHCHWRRRSEQRGHVPCGAAQGLMRCGDGRRSEKTALLWTGVRPVGTTVRWKSPLNRRHRFPLSSVQTFQLSCPRPSSTCNLLSSPRCWCWPWCSACAPARLPSSPFSSTRETIAPSTTRYLSCRDVCEADPAQGPHL
jgi:hypothetical protein